VVSKIDLSRFREAQFVRETLETACIEAALGGAALVAPRDVAALRREISAQRDCAADGDPVGFVRHDESMHRIVCSLSGHGHVWDTIAESKVHLDRIRHMSLVTQNVMRGLIRQHKAIVDAMAAHDAARAVDVARTHTRETLRVLPELQERYPDYFADAVALRPADTA
jgi:DNA-binding GntR family transcriptional regulator